MTGATAGTAVQAGWMVVLDGAMFGIGCCPDPGMVRRAVGVPSDDEVVVVRTVDAGEAVALEAVCARCGRRLVDCH